MYMYIKIQMKIYFVKVKWCGNSDNPLATSACELVKCDYNYY